MKLWMKVLYGQNAFMKSGRRDEPSAIYRKSGSLHFAIGCQTNMLFLGKADVVGDMLAMASVTMALNGHLALE